MARIPIGGIRWVDLNPVRGRKQAGKRPAMIRSQDVFNERSGTVIAVAISSQEPHAGSPLTMELEGIQLPRLSWVQIGQIRRLSVERLGRVTQEQSALVKEALSEIIGCSG